MPWTPNHWGENVCPHRGLSRLLIPACAHRRKMETIHAAIDTWADNTWPIQSVERSSDTGRRVAGPGSWFSDRATYRVILSIVNAQSGQVCRPVRTRARRGVPVNGFPLGDGDTALEGPEALGRAPCVREGLLACELCLHRTPSCRACGNGSSAMCAPWKPLNAQARR